MTTSLLLTLSWRKASMTSPRDPRGCMARPWIRLSSQLLREVSYTAENVRGSRGFLTSQQLSGAQRKSSWSWTC